MGSKYTSWDYNMTITKVKTKTTFGLFFLGAAVQNRTVPFTSHSTCRPFKKAFWLISTKSYSVGLLDFQDYWIKRTTSVYTSSSSIGTATLVGFGLPNYRWVFSAGGFYRVPLPATRQTPNLEDQWLERSNSRHQVSPTPETTRANSTSGNWKYGREISENFAESGDLHVTLGSFICRKFTTWERRLYFSSEGRRVEDVFRPKNPTASAGFEPANSGTRGQHAYL